jgi:hypothetical protein
MKNKIKVKVELEVTVKRIMDLLNGALDGACGYSFYWIESIDTHEMSVEEQEKGNPEAREWSKIGKTQYYFPWIENPFHGHAVKIKDNDKGKVWILDEKAIENGVAKFAEVCPKHFADWLSEDDDAITSDCFLQVCLFGDVIYG